MAFTPRLNPIGILGNIHWYSNSNPYEATGYGMPNCTAYAWGRFWEIGDPLGVGSHRPNPNDLPGYWNGGWWWLKFNPNVYQSGSTPALGAVICFEDTSGGDGHVAIVEQINNDGESIVTSNSAWNGSFFYTMTLYRSNNYNWGGNDGNRYRTQGFIYNPYAEQPIPPTPVGNGRGTKFPWVLYANKLRNSRSLTKYN